MQKGKYADGLICLNHAVKLSKAKAHKSTDAIYEAFKELGKVKELTGNEGIEHRPRLMIGSENPLNILVREVEEKNKFLLEKAFWRLNPN